MTRLSRFVRLKRGKTVTTRFSLGELSKMLGVPVDVVRTAVEHLAGQKELTAETFVYGQRSWRVAPSDVKRLQDWIQSGAGGENLRVERPQRRIKRKQRVQEQQRDNQ